MTPEEALETLRSVRSRDYREAVSVLAHELERLRERSALYGANVRTLHEMKRERDAAVAELRECQASFDEVERAAMAAVAERDEWKVRSALASKRWGQSQIEVVRLREALRQTLAELDNSGGVLKYDWERRAGDILRAALASEWTA